MIVLGVRRSGTTLLRVMLDRNPALAVPDESYFVPQLARRHRGTVEPASFVDDLRRLPTLAEWGLAPDAVAARLRAGMTTGEAIAAVFEAYAAERGKPRWGDKTPLYMQHLPLLERLFPEASFVHLIRDGRDAALSFLSVAEGIMTEGWGYPRDAAGFACQWATEVRAARALGERVGRGRYLELRYEALVADPAGELRRTCSFAGLEYDEAMLGYVGRDRVGPEGAPAAAERAAARRRSRLEHRDAGCGPGGVRGGRRRPPRGARLSGDGAGTRREAPRDLPGEDVGLARRRRRHAALAALAASARAARVEVRPRYAGPSRPRNATSIPFNEK